MNRVVYFELPASDPKSTAEFYRKVFGWKVGAYPEVPDYLVLVSGPEHGYGISGGVMGKYMDYVTNHIAVDNIDQYLEKVVSQGGKITTDKMYVSKLGWFAWCVDPQENMFVLAQKDKSFGEVMQDMGADEDFQVRGRFVHFEIPADDPEKLADFYREVFGWEIEKWAGPIEYYMVMTGDREEFGIDGAIMRRGNVTGTVNTIGIADLDETIALVLASGGQIVMEKEKIPGVGWFAYCADPSGNLFGLMQPDMS